MFVHSSVKGSDAPNEDRASAGVKALQNVTDHVMIIGISNKLPTVGRSGTAHQAGRLCHRGHSTSWHGIHRGLPNGAGCRPGKLSR